LLETRRFFVPSGKTVEVYLLVMGGANSGGDEMPPFSDVTKSTILKPRPDGRCIRWLLCQGISRLSERLMKRCKKKNWRWLSRCMDRGERDATRLADLALLDSETARVSSSRRTPMVRVAIIVALLSGACLQLVPQSRGCRYFFGGKNAPYHPKPHYTAARAV